MSRNPFSSMTRTGRVAMRLSLGLVAVVALAAAAGCGGSDKPAYCSDRSTLEESVKALPDLAKSGDVSGLKTQITTIQTDATTLVDAAKSDFPSETSTLNSSVDTLKSTVDGLPASPSTADIGAVAVRAANVVSAVKGFTDATSSQCD